MEDKKKDRRKIYGLYGIIGVLILVIIGISYAWLRVTLRGEKKVSIVGNKLELILDETNEGLQIENAVPVKDEKGKEVEAHTFTLENKGNQKIDYSIYLDTDKDAMKECSICEEEVADSETSCVECQELEEKDIRYELKKDNLYNTETLDSSRLLDKGTIGTEKISYELKIWLNYDADNDAQGKVFYGKIRVEGVQNTDEYDNGEPNPPVLADNMIPVVYNGYNWVKADTSSRWYDYERQMWANAVTVTNESRETYQNAEAGTKVNMSDILQMYVWIPRYSYTIKNEDGTNYYGKKEEGRETIPTKALPGEIDVKFISSSITDNGTAQYKKNEKVKGWYTPPGFKFGEKNLSGIWIGKFETGSVTGTSPGDVDTDNLVAIKPNISSWKDIRVSTLELVSMGITKAGNIYGFDQITYDAHATKNTEWALISYLTQSKYGKYGNSLYTGVNKQVYINNYNGDKTGYSSGSGIAEGSTEVGFAYDDLIDRGEGQGYGGAGASSTGNITGIYDINGGAWEYVMGVYNKMSGSTQELNSGYPGLLTDESSFISARKWPDDKYFDIYTTASTETACNGKSCKGHALNEVVLWYDDTAGMVSVDYPWLVRSGFAGNPSGIFAFGYYYGHVGAGYSFRIVLTPNN